MVTKKVTKKREAHIYFPPELYERLKKMAEVNRRTINGELIIAVEQRLSREESNGKPEN